MACAESVEEIDERHAAFNGRQVGNAGKIHDFLYVRFSKHGTAGGSRAHYVLMVQIERAWFARARAAIWKTPGRSSPATLYIFGSMRSIPCDAV